VDNLHIYLRRGAIHAPNHTPDDGLNYKPIHNKDIQSQRRATKIPCGECGVVHDYVPFYFGYWSPMLLQLKTGRVEGYDQGQQPLIYLVSSVQAVLESGASFVFSDGHGIAAYTDWYDNVVDLDKVDWNMVNERYWSDTAEDPDRHRRKQAEFLIHISCDWGLIREIGVINDHVKQHVEKIIGRFPKALHRPVSIRREWYY